jgi:hypothetical protein
MKKQIFSKNLKFSKNIKQKYEDMEYNIIDYIVKKYFINYLNV